MKAIIKLEGNVVGRATDSHLTLFDPALKAHLEKVMKSGVPIGADGGLAKANVHGLLDYLQRCGYEVEEDGGVEKAPGISESGSESADPGHLVGDGSPALEARKIAARLAKDIGAAGSPVTGGMVSTPVAGGGGRRQRKRWDPTK